MRTATIVGVALIFFAPFALLIGNLMGLITNLTDTIQIVIVSLVPAMIVSGASLIWLGQKPDEQELRRKEDIHGAIKKWLESKQDTYPLAVKPPELTVEIENCLSRKYRSIWADIQELQRKYSELLEIESGNLPDELFSEIAGVRTLSLEAFEGRKLSIRDQLEAMQRQLRHRMALDIVEKHFTRLKC